MDADGARALAERIAQGKPSDDEPVPEVVAGAIEPPSAEHVEVVHVRPGPAQQADVRIYVRGPGGKLERRP